ncbi:F-box protein [Chlorella sorokiniana]|uniref:F-box protein n=1 Tax=Chlorella sorokiniana TaxID=3076 RepID=A0A2P6TMY0_CHLSO|nr:F-box protein [Chlorella sorokiniana]|eukprot:PRW45682.1 F-box protein [Chlorella sorokiniana]
MRAFRQVLLARGFQFCDEGEPEAPVFPLPTLQVQQDTEPLILEGVEASSTDAPQQAIGCTLEDDPHSFWSSTGSQSPEACEYLLYKLKSPLCLLRNVQLVVFRAHYQFGEPVYPPAFVSFQAGPAPWNLAPPTLKFPVAATDAVQCFPLPADLPLGRYLRINLHGKRQRQLEDMQWYHAIQRVEAFGQVLPASAVVRLRASIAQRPLPAPAPGAVPSYIAAEVLRQPSAAERGNGQAAATAAAAGGPTR